MATDNDDRIHDELVRQHDATQLEQELGEQRAGGLKEVLAGLRRHPSAAAPGAVLQPDESTKQ